MSPTPGNTELHLIDRAAFREVVERTEAVKFLREEKVEEIEILRAQTKIVGTEIRRLEYQRRLVAWNKPRLLYYISKLFRTNLEIFSIIKDCRPMSEEIVRDLEKIIKDLAPLN